MSTDHSFALSANIESQNVDIIFTETDGTSSGAIQIGERYYTYQCSAQGDNVRAIITEAIKSHPKTLSAFRATVTQVEQEFAARMQKSFAKGTVGSPVKKHIVYKPNNETVGSGSSNEIRVKSCFKRSLECAKSQPTDLKPVGEGRIYALIGTSTAGKSTIIRELRQMDPKWIEREFDSVVMSYIYNRIKICAPEACELLSDSMTPDQIVDAFFAKNPPPNASKEILDAINIIKEMREEIVPKKAKTAINAELFADVIARAHQGDYVILDHMRPEPFLESLEHHTADVAMKIGLVYCPFYQLLDRIVIRNHAAIEAKNEAEWRCPINPLLHFAKLYTSAKPGDTVLEHLTRSQVEETFETAFQLTIDYFSLHDPKECAAIRSKHDINKKKLLDRLGFDDPKVTEVAITPKFKGYHYLFDPRILKPIESARIIYSWE